MALVVGGLEGELRTVEVAVGEEVAAEVVEIGDALGSGEEGQGGGLGVDVSEDLLRAAEFAAVEEEFEAEVGGEVDADSAAFRLAMFNARGRTAALAQAFFEGFTDGVSGALD